MKSMTLLACVAGAVMGAAAHSAHGQPFPAKPVRFITGNPGATADIVARHIGKGLAERWRQPVVIDNRGGAGATIAAELAARSPADGHTLLMGQLNSHGIAVSLQRKLGYHPLNDFAPIARVAWAPQVLIVHPSVPAAGLRDFVEYARHRPGFIEFASAGEGTASHLTTELFKQRAGVDLVHVPYKGGAAATRGILAGEAKTGFVPLSTAWSIAKSGRVKILASAGRQRSRAMPDVPTLDESGLPGFESTSWFGVLAPARMARGLVSRLNRDIASILESDREREALISMGLEPAPSTPQEFVVFIEQEIAKWRGVIRTAGIEPR